MLVFVGLILVIVGLIHLYLWKRLVRDPFRRGWKRRVGTIIAVLLAVLLPATLIGARRGDAAWLAWPGYVWLGLMFYLLVTLVPLELPRLALVLLWGRRMRTGKAAGEAQAATGAVESAARMAGSSPTRAATGASQGDADAARPPTQAATGTSRGDADAARPPTRAATGDAETAGPLAGSASAPGGERREGVERRLVVARGMAIFAGLTAAGITGYGMRTALGAPRLQRVRLPMAKLPRSMDGTRVVLVSDIHLGPLTGTRHVGRIVDLINSVTADVVCVVGDLVDGSVAELGRFAQPLAGIESRFGAYFVTGNHEYYSGFQQWVDEVARLGVRPLRNERVEIGGLDLAGVNDLGGAGYGDGPDFAKALGDRDRARPVVLMAHQPVMAVQAAPFGVDLQVSGHTHGGQMAPFNLLVKLQQPVVSGFGRVDGVPVFVTNGAGFWGPPVRVGAPPQVTVIDLRSE